MRIETERLVLRRWRDADAAALAAIFAHPEVERWLGASTREDAVRRIERYEHSWETLGYGRLAAEDRETGVLVGRVGVMRQDGWTATPWKDEIGWAIAPARWGEGLATEAATAALTDALGRVGLGRVVSFALPENAASLRVMVKIGLRYGGRAAWAGHTHVWFSAAADDWRRPPGGTGAA
jgi:RimJ/RimL family protein N-acetyltransferase